MLERGYLIKRTLIDKNTVSGPYFATFGLNTERYGVSTEYLSVFSTNAGEYGPEKLRIPTLLV